MHKFLTLFVALLWTLLPALMTAQPSETPPAPEVRTAPLDDIFMRDACVLVDREAGLYYMVASARGAAVRAYTSEDLVDWTGPYIVYRTPSEMWGEDVHIQGIWAPEIHKYRDRYYLFVTFSSNHLFEEQWSQWFQWRDRVRRGSQVLVSDNPLGPYEAFSNEPQLPAEKMTLDGTLWVEDGVPYMVYCHEWVQVVDGTMSKVRLSEDLSETIGEPVVLFRGSDAPWAERQEYGSWVTDGPWLYTSESGKLFMVWSSFGEGGYTVGLAVSASGRLEGPWEQQAEPLYSDDGGHPMLFESLEGQLMMALHSPNTGPNQRIHLFEMKDTGETLQVVKRLDTQSAAGQ